MSSKNMKDVTFSLESEDGNLLSDMRNLSGASPLQVTLPDPGTPEWEKLFGQGVAHVSRFRARDADKELPTSVISGPLFSSSSPSAGLQLSLASRLRANLESSGSPLFDLTWKVLDMLVEPPICQLRASGRPTSVKDFSGVVSLWPTPNAGPQNDTDTKWMQRREKLAKKYGNNGFGLTLGMAAQMTSWGTPTSRDHKDGDANLEKVPVNSLLGREVLLSDVPTEKRGRLNPEFCRWLMGFPEEWGKSVPTETQLSRK